MSNTQNQKCPRCGSGMLIPAWRHYHPRHEKYFQGVYHCLACARDWRLVDDNGKSVFVAFRITYPGKTE
jgi:DNA-directed RNA polymerase subunit RPC12/RpoP